MTSEVNNHSKLDSFPKELNVGDQKLKKLDKLVKLTALVSLIIFVALGTHLILKPDLDLGTLLLGTAGGISVGGGLTFWKIRNHLLKERGIDEEEGEMRWQLGDMVHEMQQVTGRIADGARALMNRVTNLGTE